MQPASFGSLVQLLPPRAPARTVRTKLPLLQPSLAPLARPLSTMPRPGVLPLGVVGASGGPRKCLGGK